MRSDTSEIGYSESTGILMLVFSLGWLIVTVLGMGFLKPSPFRGEFSGIWAWLNLISSLWLSVAFIRRLWIGYSAIRLSRVGISLGSCPNVIPWSAVRSARVHRSNMNSRGIIPIYIRSLRIDVDPAFSPQENAFWRLVDGFNRMTMRTSRGISEIGLDRNFDAVLAEFNKWAPENLQLNVPTFR